MAIRRSKCPSCGAAVEFRFSSTVQTVCEFCRSVLVRTDIDLKLVGKVADLPPIVSPIQIGTEGIYRDGAFVVAGRIIYEWEQGGWNEWHLVFQDGSSGWLSDAQAEYAISRAVATPDALPAAGDLLPGSSLTIAETAMTVTTRTRARYVGVDGELPFQYWDKQYVAFVDLRAADKKFTTIDYSETPPLVFAGELVSLDELRLKNLRDISAVDLRQGPQAIQCPHCGAGIERKLGGQSVSLVCAQCMSLLDSSSGALALLQEGREWHRIPPLIPLGQRGKFHGDEYEVTGFQVRTITVDDTPYSWHEYVLFNPQKGFRYLSQYNGHWNDVKATAHLPDAQGKDKVSWMGQSFRHFQTATAVTTFVLGEFPWRVRVGDQVEMMDYVAPPYLLSAEKTPGEVTWSVGEYVSGARIWEALALAGKPPDSAGVFANQPSPFRGKVLSTWAVAVWGILLLGISMLLTNLLMANREVFRRDYTFVPGTLAEAFITPEFPLDGRTANLQVRIETDLNQAWTYFNLALINVETGQAWDWGRELSYYDREGNRTDTSTLGRVPAGRYYLRIEPEWTSTRGEGTPPPVHYTLSLRRDVPGNWIYAIAILLALVPAAVQSLRSWHFEVARWEESDHPKTTSE
jgi:hypothetical protein